MGKLLLDSKRGRQPLNRGGCSTVSGLIPHSWLQLFRALITARLIEVR